MFERVKVIMMKELVDNTRDKRTLAASLAYPLLGPAMMVIMFMALGSVLQEGAEKPLELPVVGAEHAPNLMQFLEQHNAQIVEPPEDPEGAVRAGDVDVVLIIPEDFAENFEAGQPAAVRVVQDETRTSATSDIRRARTLISAYDNQIGRLRLMARGLSPAIIDPVTIETISVATDQSRAASLLFIAPYFIIFAVFLGGMYLAIDTTAGERERKSLEPLLLNPARRGEFVLGKYGATVVFTLVAVIETVIAFGIVFNKVPLEDYLGIRVQISTSAMLGMFGIALPMVFLAPALQLIIATFTRSFKEAQNYLGILPLVPALPGMVLALMPIKPKLWMMLIPTLGQQLHINKLMRGELLDPLQVAVSAIATLVAAVLLLWVAARMYQSEKVVFGR